MITLLVLCIGLFLGTGGILVLTGVQISKDKENYIVNFTIICILFIVFWLSLGGMIQSIVYLITGRFI
ncbi:hypothetical protein [Bacillus phage CP-51]|uniref:Uncharacterized protein n=1 Tax=Bacillus phage CP-51 TaxID=1391188 RepID=A0A068EMM5_9CAUD|nr:hypothetical protein OZ73_gp010 [Bacillus phage CP-51]AID50445.1 hypothetical protein [Bacillus phage CP-51]